ncbi:hypothetical protein CBR_g6656 [Chara braunii]|uniref:Uncharacterized protein n=1 Tax=Chara braunii TaxID=69332 RepID=A0A388KKK6_CHABU|nr:hypothetical protein CBR_g6656 [Chara braunii]|eukprot:GBG70528.1 hypothetical protein CBR_g6656 [Chara braunii]
MVDLRSGKSTVPQSEAEQERIAAILRERREKEKKELLKEAKLKAIVEEQAAKKKKKLEEEMKRLQQEEEERKKVGEEEAAAEKEEKEENSSKGGVGEREEKVVARRQKTSGWRRKLASGWLIYSRVKMRRRCCMCLRRRKKHHQGTNKAALNLEKCNGSANDVSSESGKWREGSLCFLMVDEDKVVEVLPCSSSRSHSSHLTHVVPEARWGEVERLGRGAAVVERTVEGVWAGASVVAGSGSYARISSLRAICDKAANDVCGEVVVAVRRVLAEVEVLAVVDVDAVVSVVAGLFVRRVVAEAEAVAVVDVNAVVLVVVVVAIVVDLGDEAVDDDGFDFFGVRLSWFTRGSVWRFFGAGGSWFAAVIGRRVISSSTRGGPAARATSRPPGVIRSDGGEGVSEDTAQPGSADGGRSFRGGIERRGSSTAHPSIVRPSTHDVGDGHTDEPRPHLTGMRDIMCPPPSHPSAADPAAHGQAAPSALPTRSFYDGAGMDRRAGDIGQTSAYGPADVPAGARSIGNVDGTCHDSMRAYEEQHGRPIRAKTSDVNDTRTATVRLSRVRKKGTGLLIPYHRRRLHPFFRNRDETRQMPAAADGRGGRREVTEWTKQVEVRRDEAARSSSTTTAPQPLRAVRPQAPTILMTPITPRGSVRRTEMTTEVVA